MIDPGDFSESALYRLLTMWRGYRGLTPAQRHQVVANLCRDDTPVATDVAEPEPERYCATCGGPIERATDPTGDYWRHIDLIPDPPHGAIPGGAA